MDYILDLLIDFLFEEGVKESQDEKNSKSKRAILKAVVLLAYLLIVSVLILFGIYELKENMAVGIGILILTTVFVIRCNIKFIQAQNKKNAEKSSDDNEGK